MLMNGGSLRPQIPMDGEPCGICYLAFAQDRNVRGVREEGGRGRSGEERVGNGMTHSRREVNRARIQKKEYPSGGLT